MKKKQTNETREYVAVTCFVWQVEGSLCIARHLSEIRKNLLEFSLYLITLERTVWYIHCAPTNFQHDKDLVSWYIGSDLYWIAIVYV